MVWSTFFFAGMIWFTRFFFFFETGVKGLPDFLYEILEENLTLSVGAFQTTLFDVVKFITYYASLGELQAFRFPRLLPAPPTI